MEKTEKRKRKEEDVREVGVRYEYQKDWIKHMVKRRKTWQQLLKERGKDEDRSGSMYFWEYCVVSGSVEIEPDKSDYDRMVWEYRLSVRMENRFGPFKEILCVKKSQICGNGFGLYSKCRFVTGEAITVISENELKMMDRKKKKQRLILGGSCAVNAGSFVKDTCNAVLTDNGVIRATQRIMVGEEILVEFHPDRFHPAMLLDAVVAKLVHEKNEKNEVVGRVDSYKRDEEGNFRYLVKYEDGSLVNLGKEEVVRNRMK